MTDTEEARKRIEYLNEGPWIEKGQRAWIEIGKRPAGAPTGKAVTSKQGELRKLLRPHWEAKIYKDEGVIRDSFDEALTLYQLYELAIETGYIEVDDIRAQVSRELNDLLWSDGARRFLQDYSYSAVVSLAQRIGVDLGFRELALPAIRKGTEGHFASFLSQHVLWYDDKILDDWLGFLDDYLKVGKVGDTDKKIFWKFLTTSQEKFDKEEKLWAFVAGADRFVMRLAELAETLADAEKPSYGLFYAYWMSKQYGYDLGENGYFRDGKQVDWSATLLKSKRIEHQIAQLKKPDANLPKNIDLNSAINSFDRRDTIVRAFWDITRMQFETDPLQFK
jgi:hypothetical protein